MTDERKDRVQKRADRLPDDVEVILLEDLTPRAPVKGGAGKLLFGQDAPADQAPDE